ncbi:MAG: hypothetical protein ABI254_14415 [Chthoniobacterales bacterium]
MSITTALASPDIRQISTSAQRNELIKQGWSATRDQIAQALRQAYSPSRLSLPGSSQNPAFVSWLNLWQWFDLLAQPEQNFLERFIRQRLMIGEDGRYVAFGPGVEISQNYRPLTDAEWSPIATQALSESQNQFGIDTSHTDEILGDAIGKDFAQVLLADDSFSKSFFLTLSNRDNVPAVLQNLKSIWEARPQQFQNYKNLALALAVVFDQPAPAYWPHAQVDPKTLPTEELSIVQRFDFWVASNEGHRTLQDIHKLTARQLEFVVDALVSRSELEWAQKNLHFPRGDFGRAFSFIHYDLGRAQRRQYSWPGKNYTLAAIHAQGGICVDQAYFAMLSGKAFGIPTLFFTGQGSDGGHAWLGYLKSDDRWDLNCGRYLNQNYAVGEALDPQTWLPINDHELSYLAERFRDSPAFFASSNELVVARLFEKANDKATEAKVLDGAISVCPAYAEAWQAKTDFLHSTEASPQAIKDHFNAALRQFPNNEEVRTFYQKELAALSRSQGDQKAAEEYEGDIVRQNRLRRSDLSVDAGAEKLKKLVGEKKFDEAFTQYHSLVVELGSKGGGNFYYEIVRPYVLALLTEKDPKGAQRAMDLAQRNLHPEPGSPLFQEFGSLDAKIKAMQGR